MSNYLIPQITEKTKLQPVEILYSVKEEIKPIPIEKEPVVHLEQKKKAPKVIEKKIQPVVKKSVEKPKEIVTIIKKEKVFKEDLPNVVLRKKLERKQSRTPVALASSNLPIEDQENKDTVELSALSAQKSRYDRSKPKDLKRTILPRSSETNSDLNPKSPTENIVVSSLKPQKKKYSKNPKTAKLVPLSSSTNSLADQPAEYAESLILKNTPQKRYKSVDEVRRTAVSEPVETNALTIDATSNSMEPKLDVSNKLTKQYTPAPNKENKSADNLPVNKDRTQLFAAQNKPESDQMVFALKSSRTSSLKSSVNGSAKAGIPIEKSSEFLRNVSIDEIDPSQLISLKELGVCVNPEEEFNLKTKLATRLTDSSRCSSNEILFFFKYTESGYTLQVDIYNPTGAYLNDKCSVLRRAIECVNNLRVKGVAQ